VARVVAFVPDLLFGSSVQAALTGAGHEVELVARLAPGVSGDLLVVDLTADVEDRIEQARASRPAGMRILAFYAHVESDVRRLAEEAGFEMVVPRSRMAREGPALVDRLSA
jgi:hypothetical protein